MEASNIFQISNEDIIGKPLINFLKKDLIILESLKSEALPKEEHYAGNNKCNIISKPIIANNELVGQLLRN